MTSRLLISVSAAALLASAGLAIAQDKGGGGPAAAPQNTSPAQQSAPPTSRTGGGEMKGGGDLNRGPERPEQKGDQPRAQDQRNQSPRAQDQRNEGKDRAQDKSDKKGSTTTGQGAAGGSGALTSEQRSKISSTIRQTNVSKTTNVNFNVSVGTVVPRTVTLHALPAAVIEVYPQWRGYRFILVEDEVIIIDPGSYRIVAVIDA